MNIFKLFWNALVHSKDSVRLFSDEIRSIVLSFYKKEYIAFIKAVTPTLRDAERGPELFNHLIRVLETRFYQYGDIYPEDVLALFRSLKLPAEFVFEPKWKISIYSHYGMFPDIPPEDNYESLRLPLIQSLRGESVPDRFTPQKYTGLTITDCIPLLTSWDAVKKLTDIIVDKVQEVNLVNPGNISKMLKPSDRCYNSFSFELSWEKPIHRIPLVVSFLEGDLWNRRSAPGIKHYNTDLFRFGLPYFSKEVYTDYHDLGNIKSLLLLLPKEIRLVSLDRAWNFIVFWMKEPETKAWRKGNKTRGRFFAVGLRVLTAFYEQTTFIIRL